ncbi:hypothetical protein KQX54_020704 [Cotesia glomerata]|uniref:Uncharacterized protein n=1 Tax=Cotesia glomerata TaxID=32391 RepID=A0AAV7I3F2_COTGL|nr:hypothetical protein KQX54_020704 [Cotesia glomerata]
MANTREEVPLKTQSRGSLEGLYFGHVSSTREGLLPLTHSTGVGYDAPRGSWEYFFYVMVMVMVLAKFKDMSCYARDLRRLKVWETCDYDGVSVGNLVASCSFMSKNKHEGKGMEGICVIFYRPMAPIAPMAPMARQPTYRIN